ncbi:MAG: 2-isopropylmalate synthase [Alphaproteobacteria bacterium]|nr:MAG: 2-isopropylmalate synthase [Alphaproteobacteria bacterium]
MTDPEVGRDPNRVVIFDTTMRDGEQAPGFSMSPADKVRMGRALKDLGVDVMEAGFAAASPGDEDCIRAVVGEMAEDDSGPVFCSLSRSSEADIDASYRALRGTQRRRCHVFIGTSPIHRTAKLRMTPDEVLAQAVRAVQYARTHFHDVEFSAEDAIRTEPEFLAEVLEAVSEVGASTLNVPDTVGYATPDEIGALYRFLIARIRPRFPNVIFSTHCHNDLGLAVANSLSAVDAGVRQVESTINGIGERAGNASLEEVVMALKVRAERYGVTTGIDTRRLVATSRILSEVTHSPIVRNKAIVGINAFAHEAGIHQHGMYADARTYEIMRPQDVGFEGSFFVLGKHSGRTAVAKRAEVLGWPLADAHLADAFAAFKTRADMIGEINDAELIAICKATQGQVAHAAA